MKDYSPFKYEWLRKIGRWFSMKSCFPYRVCYLKWNFKDGTTGRTINLNPEFMRWVENKIGNLIRSMHYKLNKKI